jgi:parallel beta-helix repeat protein
VASADGCGHTTIDGNQAGSVVTFQSGEGLDSLLYGFTLINGLAASGGGICCDNSSPTIIKNLITGNSTSVGNGAGISCCNASPMIKENIICQNITPNKGGGLYCHLSFPEVKANILSENQADIGGGISCQESSPNLISNRVHGNTASNGGGISCQNSSPKLVNNNIYDNSAFSGGGISTDTLSSPVLTNNTLYQNKADSTGGGIDCSDASFGITNTIFWKNEAPISPQIHGVNPIVTYCDVEGGWPGAGNIDEDPLFFNPSTGDFRISKDSPCRNIGDNNALDLPATDFEGDPRVFEWVVDMGADEFYQFEGVLFVPGDYMTIQEALHKAVDGNTVLVAPGTYHGKIDFLGKSVTLKSLTGPDKTIIDGDQTKTVVKLTGEEADSVLQGFTITNGSYAGIRCIDSSPTIIGNIISDNSGYGILTWDAGSVTIKGNTIFGNTGYGWGISCRDGTITDNTIFGNSSGGIYCSYGYVTTIDNNTISGNLGPGIRCPSGTMTVTNNIISGNLGSGIYCDYYLSYGYPVITGNIISDNSATTGGGIFFLSTSHATPIITNNTIVGNSASQKGGGIYSYLSGSYGKATATNNILWSNNAPKGPEIYVGHGTFAISYSDVEGGQALVYVGITFGSLKWGPGMIDADPFFLDPLNEDYHLSYASPCIDVGDNLAPSLPAADFERDPRIFPGNGRSVYLAGSSPPGAIVDMGADEYCLLKRQKVFTK